MLRDDLIQNLKSYKDITFEKVKEMDDCALESVVEDIPKLITDTIDYIETLENISGKIESVYKVIMKSGKEHFIREQYTAGYNRLADITSLISYDDRVQISDNLTVSTKEIESVEKLV